MSYKNIDSENFLFTAPLPEYFIEKIKDLGFEFDEISSKKDFLDLHNYQSIEKFMIEYKKNDRGFIFLKDKIELSTKNKKSISQKYVSCKTIC